MVENTFMSNIWKPEAGGHEPKHRVLGMATPREIKREQMWGEALIEGEVINLAAKASLGVWVLNASQDSQFLKGRSRFQAEQNGFCEHLQRGNPRARVQYAIPVCLWLPRLSLESLIQYPRSIVSHGDTFLLLHLCLEML